MKINIFLNVETLEDLKKEYHTLAMQHHPDMGGDLQTMQYINAEFDRLFPNFKNKHKNKDGVTYTSNKDTAETPEAFKIIIDALLGLHMVDVTIEIIGSFVWLSGNTIAYKDQIKALKLGFLWHSGKKAWYKKPAGYRKSSKQKTSMVDIRNMYGSIAVQQSNTVHTDIVQRPTLAF